MGPPRHLQSLCILMLLAAVHTHAQLVWNKNPRNPVLAPAIFNGVSPYGIDGAFDTRYALSPSVIFTNGLYRMWYVGYEEYWTGQFTIGYAISEDGAVWHTYTKNPVLDPRGGFELSQVWLSVVLPDSVLTMYYSGYDGVRWRVGAAKSVTGVNWRRVQANPILDVGRPGEWDDGNVWGVSVIRMGTGDYRMWYSGNHTDGPTSIGYATSSDGILWVKHPANPVIVPGPRGSWESWWVYVPRVVFADGVFHMFYLGATSSGNTQIGYAFSPDGVSWTKHARNPVLTTGEARSWEIGRAHV